MSKKHRVAKQLRPGQLTEKDMSVTREADSAWVQYKKPHANIRDYSLQHKVTMDWDLNDEAERDMMFRLAIDDYVVILDWEEVLRYGRWI